MKKIFGSLLAASLLFASHANAEVTTGAGASVDANAAQTADIANNTAFGDWIVQCEAVSVSRNVCRIVQELTLKDTDQLVVRFIALPAGEDMAILLAQVPIGAYLPGGAVYRLDLGKEVAAEDEAAKQREMIWQRCLGDLCEAAISISTAEMESFTSTGRILFGYRADVQGDPVIVQADVSRFAEAIAAIRAEN